MEADSYKQNAANWRRAKALLFQRCQLIHPSDLLSVYFNYRYVLFIKQPENLCLRCPPAFEEYGLECWTDGC